MPVLRVEKNKGKSELKTVIGMPNGYCIKITLFYFSSDVHKGECSFAYVN